MRNNRIALIVAAGVLAIPLYAQTAGELLQKGIYSQETAGDLDGAISVYRQIVNSGSSPRDIAAQAQYRLAQSLLQKGDLTNGAQEFSNLARNYADYGKLVSSLATQARGLSRPSEYDELQAERQRAIADRAQRQALEAQRVALAAARSGVTVSPEEQKSAAMLLAEVQARLQGLGVASQMLAGGRSMSSPRFDGPATTVKGIVASIAFVVPEGTITVDSADGTGKRYRFFTAGPAETARQGFTHDSLRVGDMVTITGVLANGGETFNDLITARATTIAGPDGRKIFDRAILGPSSNTCNWVSDTVPAPCPTKNAQ
jgi:hypothetical protein